MCSGIIIRSCECFLGRQNNSLNEKVQSGESHISHVIDLETSATSPTSEPDDDDSAICSMVDADLVKSEDDDCIVIEHKRGCPPVISLESSDDEEVSPSLPMHALQIQVLTVVRKPRKVALSPAFVVARHLPGTSNPLKRPYSAVNELERGLFEMPVHVCAKQPRPDTFTDHSHCLDALSRMAHALETPNPRPIQHLEELGCNASCLQVCSYNVLCQSTAERTSYLYSHIKRDPSILNWEHRKKLLAVEFASINADVFGLQEVENTAVEDFFVPTFRDLGYDSIHYPKTGGASNEGSLVAFRKSRLKLLDHHNVDFYQGERCEGNDGVLDRHQIAIICVFLDLCSGQKFCFATTHLLFNEKRGDIKLGQLMVLFSSIHKDDSFPVIITGDFNIEPLSKVYQFITEAELDVCALDRCRLSGQLKSSSLELYRAVTLPLLSSLCGISAASVRDYAFVKDTSGRISHQLKLASVDHHRAIDGAPAISTFHAEAKNPDFIFYSIKSAQKKNGKLQIVEYDDFRLMSRVLLPSEQLIRDLRLGPWPNSRIPSDHVPLIANFKLRHVT